MPARRKVIWALLLALLFVTSGTAVAVPADLIITNARIYRDDGIFAETVAIRGNRILAVGSGTTVETVRGPATRVIDAGGRTIIPGLIDSHIHAVRAGLTFTTEASFVGTRTVAEAMRRISDAAARTPPGTWVIVAGGWTPQQFAENRKPTRAELAAAAPGRPVYLQLFYRGVLLTAKAIEALGLAREGLPQGASEEADVDGKPTGWIAGDSRAITALYERLPRNDVTRRMEGTKAFFSELNRYGVTGVVDPGGHNVVPEDYEALFRLWRNGALTVRVSYSICAPTPGRELEEYRAFTRFLPTGTGDDWLRFIGIGERVTWAMNNNHAPNDTQVRAYVNVALG
ncbi:MAG: amidohydrolase family protein, partial [Alphaproteobacteria bacterium]